MKRFLSSLIVAVLAAASLATAAFAAGTPELDVSDVKANAGETATVEISIKNNPGFGDYGIVLHYDADALELNSIDGGALTSSITVNTAYDTAAGFATYFGIKDVTGDGVLFTATFKIKESKTGNFNVSAVVDSSCAADGTVLTIASGSGTIHAHKYAASVTAPTCTEKGYTTYTCSCGDSYASDYVAAKGHGATELKNAKAATCTEKGYTGDKYCTVCGGKVETGTVIPAKGHNYQWVIDKEATATKTGSKHEACTVCGDKKEAVVIPATGTTEPEVTPTPNTKPATTPDTKPATTPDTKPETTPDAQPETTPDAQPETTPDAQPETTPDTEPETTPDAGTDGSKPGGSNAVLVWSVVIVVAVALFVGAMIYRKKRKAK